MSALALDQTLAQLRSGLSTSPERIDAASHALRAQVEQLRRRPAAITAEQLQQARRQLLELAELARLRLRTAQKLQRAMHADAPAAGYGRRGLLR